MALILFRITSLPAAWGEDQLTRQLQWERLDAFFKRARKFNFYDKNHNTADLV